MRTYLKILILTVVWLISYPAMAKKTDGGSHAVKGHIKKDGTYIQPHRATNPNNTQRDNWSSKPNINPYNGNLGKKDPEK